MTQNTSMSGPASLIGKEAPDFQLPSIQDELISLANYRHRCHIVLWFSRGFTCNFCRGYMEGVIRYYNDLRAHDIEVIQVAPNLLETARTFFAQPPPFPFVCDPDKRLYAVYELGDRGVIEATRNTVVSFATAATSGEGMNNVRGSWLDVMNRNFIRRLHHHALTAVDQGMFIIDKEGVIRYQMNVRSLEAIPTGQELLALAEKSVMQGLEIGD